MKTIFNSLGSNYNWRFILLSLGQLIGFPNPGEKKLKNQIAQLWNLDSKQVELVYKGRDAIELALRSHKIGEGDEVITQAFTCYAIEEAITRTGARPVYVDLTDGSLNPSVKTLEKAFQRSKNPKVVLIQHTLGHPADIKSIQKWAQEKKLLLIEDLAQTIGGTDNDGQVLGSLADAIILSFGRDKIIDSVSGGAVVFKKKPLQKIALSEQVSFPILFKELTYPFLTWKIRFFHGIGVGKIVHWLAVKLKLIESPTKSFTNQLSALPKKYRAGVLFQLKSLGEELSHRREIAQFYKDNLKSSERVALLTSQESIKNGSNLRFAISLENPQKLAEYLAKNKIYLADRWYREAVDCGRLACQSVYESGSCPNAEKLSKNIFNLPTHKHISIVEANKIIKAINTWNNS